MARRRTNAQIEWLLGQLLEQGYRLDQRGAASQLAYSSFDSSPGAGIKEYDPETGNVVANYGTQFDGSHGAVAFSGPRPPTPTPALTRPGVGTLASGWDGVFVDEAGVRDIQIIPPMDFSHVEVHVSQDENFTAEFADTLVGTINTARGGWVAAVVGAGIVYVRLVARTTSGNRSAASPPVAVNVLAPPDPEALREEWEAADSALNEALAENAQQQQTLANTLNTLKDTTVPGLSTDLAAAKTRLTTAETTLASTTTTADNAATAAGNAAATANTAVTLANGKNMRRFSTSPPGTAPGVAGDVWSRRDNNGIVIENWLHNGTTWTTYQLGDGSLSNLDVGKLTAGTAVIVQAVAQKIAAGTAAIQTADIGNLFVTGDSALNTVTAQRIAANVGQYMELSVGQLVAGTASLGTAVADKLFADIFSTRKLSAEQVLIGDGNRIMDPEFVDPVIVANRLATNPGWQWEESASGANPAVFRRNLTTTGTYHFSFWAGPQALNPTKDYASMIQVTPGERFSFFAWVENNGPVNWSWRVTTFNGAGTITETVAGTVTPRTATTRGILRADWTVPAGVSYISPRLLMTPTGTPTTGTPVALRIWGGGFVRKVGVEPLALFADTNISSVPYDLKISMGARNVSGFGASGESVPGMWISSRRKDQTDTAPGIEPGVASTGGAGVGGVQIHSGALSGLLDSMWSRAYADPGKAGMEARRSPSEPLPARGYLEVTPTTFQLYNTAPGVSPSGTQRAGVVHAGDGLLQLIGEVRGDATTATMCTLANSFTHYQTGGWNGLRWQRFGPLIIVNGAITRSTAWGGGIIAWNIPVGLRPAYMFQGVNCQVTATTLTVSAGSTPISVSAAYFAVN